MLRFVTLLGLLALALSQGLAEVAASADGTGFLKMGPDAFVNLGDNATWSADAGGGVVRRVNGGSFPVLSGLAISYAVFKLAPCGVNAPHVHPRATELLYVIDAKNGKSLKTGLVLEETDPATDAILHQLGTGDITVFPQGQIHFEWNDGCEELMFISALSSDASGVLPVAKGLFKLPVPDALDTILGQSTDATAAIASGVPSDSILKGSDACLKRCAAGGVSSPSSYNPTPAPIAATAPLAP